ncbi:hypothetical protein SAMN04488101_101669 [Pedobacter nyackensis]|uniref:Uncharacterized protein n=2 Tax=Pedobacter nyackensis TaxID=475255 RepID=A0A1W2AJY0_9SPHI|nr:hypothetical protein SAMN04488101_101669 [Pedobacter nyackensis]
MMRIIYFINLIMISASMSYAQKSPFVIKEVVDTLAEKKSPGDFINSNYVFFEDDEYIATKTCSGEWGGTVKFKNKKSGIEYACSSSCPVMVNKMSGKYIVTSTLAHLRGSSRIIEIDNPQSMSVFKLSKPRKKHGVIIKYVGDDESKSMQGTRSLIDTIGVLTLASFPYQGELFHVVTDFHTTFLAKISDGKFVNVDTISEKSIWTYNPQVIRTTDNKYIIFFDNKETNGYIEILDNTIVLMRYK